LSFNLGVEIGQVIVLAVALPVLALLVRVPAMARFGVAVASDVVGHTAWHWMIDRLGVLPSLEWPALSEATVAAMARVVIALMLMGAGIHVLTCRAGATDWRTPDREQDSYREHTGGGARGLMHGTVGI
jgi:hypothetical protein